MTSHTPGPWKAKGRDGRYLSADDWDVRNETSGCMHWVPVKAGRKAVALIVAKGMPEDSDVAGNARLIAAAPDLLAALIEAVEFAEQDFHALTPRGEAMLNCWRGAIAKATGTAE